MVSSCGSEKDTFFTRFLLGPVVCGAVLLGKSSNEQTEFVGEDRRVSGVAARELMDPAGEWQLEPLELTDSVRALVIIESSAASIKAAARSKCVRACCRRLMRDGEMGGKVRAQSSIEVAA